MQNNLTYYDKFEVEGKLVAEMTGIIITDRQYAISLIIQEQDLYNLNKVTVNEQFNTFKTYVENLANQNGFTLT